MGMNGAQGDKDIKVLKIQMAYDGKRSERKAVSIPAGYED